MRVGDNLEVRSGLVDANATADSFEFRPSYPVRVVRWGVVCGVAMTGTGAIELDHITYAADGTPTREEAAGGMALTTAAGALTLGEVLYCEPAENDPVDCKPGDALVLQTSTGWTAGDGYYFIQFQQLNWDDTGDNATFNDATRTFGKLIDGGVAA